MEHNRLESAKFAQLSDDAMLKMVDGVEKALSDSAARGFPVPGAETLTTILNTTIAAKELICEGNGKIYDERSGQIFEVQKFALEYLVKVAKFAMELYREQLFNAIAIEQAQEATDMERGRADIARLNTKIESRMAAIIRDKADMEQRILTYKQQLVDAEAVTVSAESVLEDARLTTAEKKLEIIDSLYQVLAAEQLVLVAERRQAASLEKVLVAQQRVAAVKREMVPFYIQKAQARQVLAKATQDEIPILKAIEELGYDRIALRDADEDEKHQERQMDLEYELAMEDYTRANGANEFARRRVHTLMLEYSNSIKDYILGQRKSLMEDEVDFRLATGLSRETITVNNEVEVLGHEKTNLETELTSVLTNLEDRAGDEATKIKKSATTEGKRTTTHLFSRRILKGFIVG